MFGNLIWSEEFNYSGAPDSTKWTYQTGATGWGNNELEYYTTNIQNAYVKNGVLNISAINQPYPVTVSNSTVPTANMFTSARLVTLGKATFNYGRIQISAKLPSANGTWSAIWLYGRGNTYSEIDIVENVGYEKTQVWFSTHSESGDTNPAAHHTASITVNGTDTAFHLYSIDWTPDYILGFVDGVQFFSLYKKDIDPSLWTFDSGMFLILNLAVGGTWGGYEGVNNSAFPQTMQVDYVRVYEYIPKTSSSTSLSSSSLSSSSSSLSSSSSSLSSATSS